MRQPDLIAHRLTAVLALSTSAIATAGLLSACGSSSRSASSPRGAVSAFDADLAAGHDGAACRRLGPIPQAVLIDADTTAQRRPSCASALTSAGTRRTLENLTIPADQVSHTTVSDQPGGTVAVQSAKPRPVTYVLAKQHGHWLIVGL